MPRVLISGASGLVGSALVPFLKSQGCEITRLVRHVPRASTELQWEPRQPVPPNLVSGFDAVIHLSGENVSGRWTEAKKQRIRESRVISTRNLAQALAAAKDKPAAFVCASAIGYYGSRGDEILTEDSASGRGFLAEVCREWEKATGPASDAGIRTLNLRIGIVLSKSGGALKQMLLPFRLGLGGRIGNGRQWWSWIHIDDVIAAVWQALHANISMEHQTSPTSELRGPINLVSPNPLTNLEFARTLARALHRPAVLPVPAFVAKLAFGELADEGLLASARVKPEKLLQSKFKFEFTNLAEALSRLL